MAIACAIVVDTLVDRGWVHYIFTSLFLAEAVVKMMAYGLRYFADKWNLFDFIILFTIRFQVLRVLRLTRLLKLLSLHAPLYAACEHLCRSLMAPVLLTTLATCVYAVVWVHLFGRVEIKALDFELFPQACLTLVRCVAGAPWHDLLHMKSGADYTVTLFFLISYLVINKMIFFLWVAIICDGYFIDVR